MPGYLTARDEPWVRVLLEEIDVRVGDTVSRLESEWESRILPRVRSLGARPRAAMAAYHVLRRRYASAVHAAAKPAEIRLAVFEEAARGLPRDEAIARAVSRLGISEVELLDGMFADRAAERRLRAPECALSPKEVTEAHNLALVQGFLLRAEEISVDVREHVRSVVRYAKLRRLIVTCAVTDKGSTLCLSGPLSLFHKTTRYGLAMAAFAPSVFVTPGFRLAARCELRGESLRLQVASGDPVGSTFALPRATDSQVERRLVRDVRKLRTSWEIRRETAAIVAGDRMFFPDFSLERGADRVLVEVIGFYMPEYLRAKLASLRAAGLTRIVVCIDADLACADGDVAAPEVLRFRRRVDAAELIAAAERLVG